jgi:hypothetical protein
MGERKRERERNSKDIKILKKNQIKILEIKSSIR